MRPERNRMTPFQAMIIKFGQAIVITLFLAGLLMTVLTIFDPVQYISIRMCTQLTPWNTECITTTVTIDEFQRRLEATQDD